MKKAVVLIILIYSLFSCAKPVIEDKTNETGKESTLATKAINTSLNASEDKLLITLDNGGVLTDELKAAGVSRLERLFEQTPGSEDLIRRLGMDKWYIAYLNNHINAEKASFSLSNVESVEKIQFNTYLSGKAYGPAVPYQELLYPTKATGSFNDPSLSDQWSYINTGDKSISSHAKAGADINIKNVWSSLTTGDPSIIVAVIDEGVKYTHPDLEANMWTGKDGSHGKNFVTNGPITWNKEKDTGHGTHCAGIIAAVNNNNLGVCGIAGGSGNSDGVKIMSCQIFDGPLGGDAISTSRAIQYAADNGASVISCSFGYQKDIFRGDAEYEKYSPSDVVALRYFESPEKANNPVLNGNIAIFAAGNESDPHAYYPGALSFIVSVSALGPDLLPAYYTNYGPGCNIAAPGGEIYQKTPDGKPTVKSAILSTVVKEINGSDYGYMQGTSQACPHVSGIAALGLSYAKKLGKKFTVQEFKNMIITAANDIDSEIQAVGNKSSYSNQGGDVTKYYHMMGTGAIDAWKFMMKVEGIPSIQVENGKSDWVDLSDYFGTAYSQLTYLKVEVLGNGKEDLGISEEPYIKHNRLFIHPTKIGACKIRVTAVGGGNELGGDNSIGGMEVSQDISIISRPTLSSNGAWL